MKNIKIRFFILCLCLSVTGYTSASARTEKVKTDIDWPAFMQKQDLIGLYGQRYVGTYDL